MTFKKLCLLGAALLALGLSTTGCNQTIDRQLMLRAESERLFKTFADSTSYKKVSINSIQGDGYVYVKQLNDIKPKAGDRMPLQTDRVVIQFRQYFLSDWVTHKDKAVPFRDNYEIPNPQSKPLMREIPGLAIVLQQMVVGQEVAVAIPWQLSGGNDLIISPFAALYSVVKLKGIE